MKMDAIRQKLRQWVQTYYDRLECLFVKGIILDAKSRRRFLAHLRPEIKKLCVVHTYADMDELLVVAIEVEKVFREIREMPFEPLKEERDEEANEGELNKRYIHAFDEMLINFFKGSSGKEIISSRNPRNLGVCHLCNMVGHGAFTCSKLSNRSKCGKCGGGHRTENCGLKCSYCFGLHGHKKECC